ncbi:MAG: type II toxin-antitoxin system HicB family antitoxin [bacterium]|nr:type II toxin-antitoxin system HicB family antitoxin [bacterium]
MKSNKNFFKVILEPDEEVGGYVAYCPTLHGCVSEGDTAEDALGNIRKAINGYLTVLEEEILAKKDVFIYEVAV